MSDDYRPSAIQKAFEDYYLAVDRVRISPANNPNQSDRELAELIAEFRMPHGFDWKPLADDIERLLIHRRRVS